MAFVYYCIAKCLGSQRFASLPWFAVFQVLYRLQNQKHTEECGYDSIRQLTPFMFTMPICPFSGLFGQFPLYAMSFVAKFLLAS